MSDVDRSVGARLRRLRGQPEQPPAQDQAFPVDPGHPGCRQPSFAERVQRLMVGPSVVRQREPDEAALRHLLGAETIAPGVLLVERRFDLRYRHGRAGLPKPDGDLKTQAMGLPGLGGLGGHCEDLGAIVCFDTETSGLSGGVGTWAFMTGVLSAEADGWRLRQYLLTQLDAEPDYLAAVRGALDGVGLLVSYNGRAFDAPLLAGRFRLAAQPDPLPGLRHLDLLMAVRRAYSRVWPDCRLASAEQHLLGFQREGDLPGSAAPAAWLGWLRQGEMAPLAGVLRHNRWDLLSLAALVPVLVLAYRDPGSLGADPLAVAAHHRAGGRENEAIRVLENEQHRLSAEALMMLAKLYRRAGCWELACELWERLSGAGDVEARVALAKYHEHRTRDAARALDLACGLPEGPERDRRCERLRAKLLRRSDPM